MFPQVCSAGSRLLIQESVFDDVIARIKARMSRLRLGDCLDKTIDMGTLVDESQKRSVHDMVESARAEGAQVLPCSVLDPTNSFSSSSSKNLSDYDVKLCWKFMWTLLHFMLIWNTCITHI